jgi:hypothetical protein
VATRHTPATVLAVTSTNSRIEPVLGRHIKTWMAVKAHRAEDKIANGNFRATNACITKPLAERMRREIAGHRVAAFFVSRPNKSGGSSMNGLGQGNRSVEVPFLGLEAMMSRLSKPQLSQNSFGQQLCKRRTRVDRGQHRDSCS